MRHYILFDTRRGIDYAVKFLEEREIYVNVYIPQGAIEFFTDEDINAGDLWAEDFYDEEDDL